jgi:hypothetical protein
MLIREPSAYLINPGDAVGAIRLVGEHNQIFPGWSMVVAYVGPDWQPQPHSTHTYFNV